MHTGQGNTTPKRTGRKKGWTTVCARVSPDEQKLIDSAITVGGYAHRDALVRDAVIGKVRSILRRQRADDLRQTEREAA